MFKIFYYDDRNRWRQPHPFDGMMFGQSGFPPQGSPPFHPPPQGFPPHYQQPSFFHQGPPMPPPFYQPPPFLQGQLGAFFKDKDGKFDFNKVKSTAGYVMNGYNMIKQVSPILSLFK
ncbi:YppG family protein [Bacillus taeanensis]|uniref:Spore coat protein n=1 Tax=Bacillus taeanensis TaxID=273032 RepID=A0A366XUY9_9BACI|nr:YppG family protein [Bacillus taeanensis]RBW69717.1 hypothetical protein DS031_09265 [Bacillus taeanensis]